MLLVACYELINLVDVAVDVDAKFVVVVLLWSFILVIMRYIHSSHSYGLAYLLTANALIIACRI